MVFKSAAPHFTLSIKWAGDNYELEITCTCICRPCNVNLKDVTFKWEWNGIWYGGVSFFTFLSQILFFKWIHLNHLPSQQLKSAKHDEGFLSVLPDASVKL